MRTPEVHEVLGAFIELLEGPSGDGSTKREAGLKPSWKIDPSHYDAAIRHVLRYDGGERVDSDSGCHPLTHAAWRLLAVAYQDTHIAGDDV